MVPTLVQRALALAAEHHFVDSSSPETGRLLCGIVSDAIPGTVLEIGTGYGHGTAWILEGRRGDQHVITVDNDGQKTRAVNDAFLDQKNLDIVTADWREVLAKGPFAVIFADGGRAKETHPHLLLEALEMGGSIVMDDLTMEDGWPQQWRGKVDQVRSFWLNHPEVVATETNIGGNHVMLVAVRLRDHRGRGGLPLHAD